MKNQNPAGGRGLRPDGHPEEATTSVAALPTVAIVGRANVGKSTLFSRLARRRLAIVDPTPGVTRDRLSTAISHEGRRFEIVDTGGVGTPDQAAVRRDAGGPLRAVR